MLEWNPVLFLWWRPSPATTNVALNFTEYHLLAGFQPSLPYQGRERCRKETWKWKWKWYRAHGWPRLSCDFADVGFEGRPEQRQSGLGSFFPSGADRMSLMNHSVFHLSHLNSPHHFCAQRGKEHAVEQGKILWRIHQIQEMLSQKPQIKRWIWSVEASLANT